MNKKIAGIVLALIVVIAAAGGTWQVAILGLAGMVVDGEGNLRFEPRLPAQWKSLSFQVVWRGSLLGVEIEGDSVEIKTLDEDIQDNTL